MQNLNDIPIKELSLVIKGLGLKAFAASQIIQWIYKKGASSFDEMTNLSKDAREILKKEFYIGGLELVRILESDDGTKKFAWKLEDGNIIESVLIPAEPYSKIPKNHRTIEPSDYRTRLTLCISTQVGCAMGCDFCRTGDMGFVRNLTQGEIVGQILEAQRLIIRQAQDERSQHSARGEPVEPRVTNVVLMGMGEPLANYDNVLSALHIMLNTKCLGLSRRHVTLSTCGLVPEIERFASDNPGVKLAISLNSTTDEQREKLMPVTKKYPLSKLFSALKKYSNITKKSVITFEYVMIGDYNDSHEDAKRLVKLLSQFPSKVNLIPLNACHPEREARRISGDSSALRPQNDIPLPPTEETVQRFAQFLRNKHIQVNIRASRGQDILAACGQLASTSS